MPWSLEVLVFCMQDAQYNIFYLTSFASGLDLCLWLIKWIVNPLESLLNNYLSIGVNSSDLIYFEILKLGAMLFCLQITVNILLFFGPIS